MLYFSYGSNMSMRRIRIRVPSARFVTVGRLYGHALRFHKVGKDDSGKCDACKTGNDTDFVYGVVYEISDLDKPGLDRREDLGYGYGEKIVEVISAGHGLLKAITYYAFRIDPSLKPFHWYKEHVLIGAKENGLPETYIQMLSAVVSVDDPVQVRCKKELAIYI